MPELVQPLDSRVPVRLTVQECVTDDLILERADLLAILRDAHADAVAA